MKRKIGMDYGIRLLPEKKAGLALAILFAVKLLAFSLMARLLNWGLPAFRILASMLPGYDLSLFGAAIGMVWVFLIGFLTGYFFAFVYNKLK